MTTGDVLAALWRRWYILVLGILCTCLALTLVRAEPGVYWTQVSVMLLAPQGTLDNDLVDIADGLVATAGLVERTINQGHTLPATASSDVTMPSRGLRRGALILLPNDGGQWSYHFIRPSLTVQAVGRNPEEVSAQRDRAVARIRSTLRRMQAEDGIPTKRQIRTQVVPQAAPVEYATGRRSRAMGMTLLLGASLSVTTVTWVDRRLLSRTARRRRVGVHDAT